MALPVISKDVSTPWVPPGDKFLKQLGKVTEKNCWDLVWGQSWALDVLRVLNIISKIGFIAWEQVIDKVILSWKQVN